MKRYRHVLFDFDGVIADSLGLAIEAFNTIRDQHFLQLPRVTCQADMTVVYAGSLRASLFKWLSPDDSRRFFDLHSARMAEQAESLPIFPGIARSMSALGDKRASIVTSAYSQAVQRVLLRDTDFDENCLFEIAGRELHQPKTTKIQAILDRLGIRAEEAVYVGDLESDILYCRDVPMDIIAVGYGYHPSSYLKTKNPAYVAETVDELDALLVQVAALSS